MRAAAVLTLAVSLACLGTPLEAQQKDVKPMDAQQKDVKPMDVQQKVGKPMDAQQKEVKPGTVISSDTDPASRTRSVTGTIKTSTDKGVVVVGRETGQTNDKEWAFAIDPVTRIEASGGKMQVASALREGDAVTVTYSDRDGKVIAQSIKLSAR